MSTFRHTLSLLLVCGVAGVATAQDAARESLIRDAVARFEAERSRAVPVVADRGGIVVAQGPLRDLRLDEAVELALAQNLDIAVERLNPQAADFQLAGLRNLYRPLASSTLGQRSQVNPPTNQLNGGQRVTNDTTTYNFGVSQEVPWGGGNFALTFNNTRLSTSNLFANYNPTFTSTLTATFVQPLLRDFRIDNNRQQIAVVQINRDIAEEALRATVAQTAANVRNAYWELAYARAAVEVAQRSLELAQKLVEDNQARVEVGTLAPIDVVQAEAEAANRRQTLAQAEATLATAQLTLKRLLVTGTSDPLWTQELRAVDLPQLAVAPLDVESAVRNALERRTDLATARKNLDGNDVTLRFWRNQTLPAVDLQVNYGAQGIGGTQYIRSGTGLGSQVTGTIPGGYSDALQLLSARDFPTWNAALTVSYPIGGNNADGQYARARVQRTQQSTRLRALELQVATEVTNAALQVQANLRRVEAARAARALAERQLEAEQSKFEVGLSTNFFVVQSQRDLADAQNVELRALTDLQRALVTFERAQEAPAGGGGTTGGGQPGAQTTGGGQAAGQGG
ncbi:MAG: TolC family protein [Vicinamibacterales bacterium]